MKPKRNKKLAENFRGSPCIVCGSRNGSSGDHILTFGSRPDLDIGNNIWPLCFKHHEEKGRGLTAFVERYSLAHELKGRGYWFDHVSNKWRYPNGNSK